MTYKLYIPNKIRIGFSKNSNTSFGQIAYIIGFDEKGFLRNQSYWNRVRDQDIPYIDLENIPTDGFIFNKDFSEEILNYDPYLFVQHPNKFEFEISNNNLICLLLRNAISKKTINGKCIFVFDEYDNLNLIPVDSFEYKEAINYTEKLLNSISTKNLKKGFKYSIKKSDESLTYLGYFNFFKYSYFDFKSIITQKNFSTSSKKHVFYDKNGKFSTPSISTLVSCISDIMDNDYEKNLDVFFKSKYSNKLNTFFLDEPTIRNDQKYSDTIFKDYGKEKVYAICFNYNKKENISFNKDTKQFEGFRFYVYDLTFQGYKRKNIETMFSSTEEINEFLSIFPEILERPISLEAFLIMAKENGFKSVYLKTEVEDSIKYRL